MSTIVACIAPETIPDVWDRVRPLIDKGYEPGDDKMPADMLQRLTTGAVQLWLAMEDSNGVILGALTTELVPMRSGLVCWLCQCGGERLHDWAHFIAMVEDYARIEGCVKVAMRGRKGWQRVLPGYSVRTVQLEKVL